MVLMEGTKETQMHVFRSWVEVGGRACVQALKGTAWFSMTCLQLPRQGLAIGNMGNFVPLSELLGFPLQDNN